MTCAYCGREATRRVVIDENHVWLCSERCAAEFVRCRARRRVRDLVQRRRIGQHIIWKVSR